MCLCAVWYLAAVAVAVDDSEVLLAKDRVPVVIAALKALDVNNTQYLEAVMKEL